MELVAKQTKKQWNYWQNQANFLGTIWAHTKNPCGLWVKIEKSSNEWNEQCSISFHDTYIHYFCFIQRKAQTKYETNQASSASLFEPIRKVAFKSYITLRFFKVKNQKNTKMNNQHGVRLRFSNQQLTNVWKTKRIVLLLVAALSSKCQTREATTKDSVESWEKQAMILEIRASVHLSTIMCWFDFIRLVDK